MEDGLELKIQEQGAELEKVGNETLKEAMDGEMQLAEGSHSEEDERLIPPANKKRRMQKWRKKKKIISTTTLEAIRTGTSSCYCRRHKLTSYCGLQENSPNKILHEIITHHIGDKEQDEVGEQETGDMPEDKDERENQLVMDQIIKDDGLSPKSIIKGRKGKTRVENLMPTKRGTKSSIK
ncbi:hypothetical protein HAX54_041344 [Datura stramonium]|uniref:Protein Ycf2-like n=1 Tax=Datura stramonium TaxID=4076 RepID=A0ABS8SKW2_DATST|nr:hypothetical protein [Datura stramonium]